MKSVKIFKTKNGTNSRVGVEKTIVGFRTFRVVSKKDHKGRDVKTETIYHGDSLSEAVHIAKKLVKDMEEMGL